MKKLALLLPLLILLLACNKEEKFPTKKDLKGRWERCLDETPTWPFYYELIFENRSVELISSFKDTVCSVTCNYRLDVAAKKMVFTSGVKKGVILDIWIDKNNGLLYLINNDRITQDVVLPAVYKKIE